MCVLGIKGEEKTVHNLILIGEKEKRKDTYTPTLATVGKVSISKSKELINAFLII